MKLAVSTMALSLAASPASAADAIQLRAIVEPTTKTPSPCMEQPSIASICIRLQGDSGAALTRYTQAHLNEQVDVKVDGVVVMSPRIMSPISGDTLLTSFPNREEADAMLKKLRGRELTLTVETRP